MTQSEPQRVLTLNSKLFSPHTPWYTAALPCHGSSEPAEWMSESAICKYSVSVKNGLLRRFQFISRWIVTKDLLRLWGIRHICTLKQRLQVNRDRKLLVSLNERPTRNSDYSVPSQICRTLQHFTGLSEREGSCFLFLILITWNEKITSQCVFFLQFICYYS